MWRRVKNFGGLFLLFLLFCAIISCIQPNTATTTETISSTENTISFTENTISSAGDTISTEDTITWAENVIFCTSIIDGDTFRLSTGETVRLIGIDAPELSQPGGEESREYLAQLIKGKGITLEKGFEDRDTYNRLLRFVYIGNLCINEEMIRQGYAEARYMSPEDPLREYYIQLEIEAEITKAGLWSENIFQPRSQLNWDSDVPVILWSDADNYYNQYVIIEGTIVNTYNSGNVCFLNFHTDYEYFTAVIFASDFPGFPMSPEVFYRGKKVYIIGIIREYKGSPEIIVKTPDQIRIRNYFHFFLFFFSSFCNFTL
ncbi:MAG: thermonuclease family protein [Theionarchaea archaeon]|nr:thermonuclease family protein [Theionarchaea archaeon]